MHTQTHKHTNTHRRTLPWITSLLLNKGKKQWNDNKWMFDVAWNHLINTLMKCIQQTITITITILATKTPLRTMNINNSAIIII